MYTQNFSGLFFGVGISFGTLIFFLAATSARADTDWQPRFDQDGINIETRSFPGSRREEFRATVEVDAGIAAALALLQDYETHVQWVHRCRESRLLSKTGNNDRLLYQVTDLPFPIKSRDAIFHITVTYNQDESVLVSLQARPQQLEETEHVRITDAFGHYLFQPLAENRTRMTWQLYVDPAGSLPAWVVNSMLTEIPHLSLKNFRRLVVMPPYRDATFVYDDEGKPVDVAITVR